MSTFKDATDTVLSQAWDALRGRRPYEQIADIYDVDDAVSGALSALPGFEYPNWSYRTVGEMRKAISNAKGN